MLARVVSGCTVAVGDGSGQGGIAAGVPRVALPTGCVLTRGFNSLPFYLRGLAETQHAFGLVG